MSLTKKILLGFLGLIAIAAANNAYIEAKKTPEQKKAQAEQLQQREVENKKVAAEWAKHRANLNSATCTKDKTAILGEHSSRTLKCGWGKPDHINRTTTINGTREQWVYPGGYLYFYDGILASIQN